MECSGCIYRLAGVAPPPRRTLLGATWCRLGQQRRRRCHRGCCRYRCPCRWRWRVRFSYPARCRRPAPWHARFSESAPPREQALLAPPPLPLPPLEVVLGELVASLTRRRLSVPSLPAAQTSEIVVGRVRPLRFPPAPPQSPRAEAVVDRRRRGRRRSWRRRI